MPRLPDANDLGARPTPVSRRGIATVRNAGAMGAAVEGAGEVLSQGARRLDELEQRRQAAQAGVNFATMAGEIQIDSDEKRAKAAAGGAGHAAAVATFADKRISQFLAGIQDKRVRQTFEADTAQLRARLFSNENAWEIAQRRDFAVTNVEDTARLLGNQLRTNPMAESLENYLGVIRSTIVAQDALSTDLVEKLVKEKQGTITKAYIQGLKERDPGAAREVLRSGRLDIFLPEDARAALTDQVDVEVRARDAEARRELATSQTAARTQIQIFEKRLQAHDPTITDEEIEQHQKLATEALLPADAYDLAKARVMREVDRLYSNAPALEIGNAIRELNTRISQAGDKAGPSDVVRRDHLQSLLATRQTEDANDPLTSYTRRGGRVDAVDFAKPATVQARIAAARAAEEQTGHLAFYTPQEVSVVREQGGLRGATMSTIINQLAEIGRFDPLVAQAAAEQVAPDNPVVGYAIRLNRSTRDLVVRGAEARKLLSSKVRVDGDSSLASDSTSGINATTSFENATQAWFLRHVAPTLARSRPAFATGVLETSRNIYAEMIRTAGANGQEQFSEQVFENAVNLALNRTAAGGGLGRWSWGVTQGDDFPAVLLPTRMKQSEFDARIANISRTAFRQGWDSIANGVPSYTNGQAIPAQDLRKRYLAVPVGDGLYQFERGNEIVTTESGRFFTLDVRKIPPAKIGKFEPEKPDTRSHVWIAPPPIENNVRGPVWIAPPPPDTAK